MIKTTNFKYIIHFLYNFGTKYSYKNLKICQQNKLITSFLNFLGSSKILSSLGSLLTNVDLISQGKFLQYKFFLIIQKSMN